LQQACCTCSMTESLPQVEWVLIGEGSHGTHEYYQLRADVTKLLIEKRGFNAVATEAGEMCTKMKLAC
jgi:erythromycin esterase-like protein